MTKWFSRCMRRQVVITTTGGTTYRGYIVEGDRHAVVLSQVELLPVDGEPVEMSGVCVVLREQIAEPIQLPGGTA